MKLNNLVPFTVGITTMGLLAIAPTPATSATLTWTYTLDSPNDGYNSGILGENSNYELYYAVHRSDEQRLYFAFNNNMPLSGVPTSTALNGSVSWGDLFLNFSGQDFDTAHDSGSLFGIRFTEFNDSGVASLGLYTGITAQSVTHLNNGFQSLSDYNSRVANAGGVPSLGDLEANTNYFNQTNPMRNVMATGTRIGDIEPLSAEQLGSLMPGQGRYSYGFSVDRSLLPTGSFIANLYAECINEGVAIAGLNPERSSSTNQSAVPEPSLMLGILSVGGAILYHRKRQS